MTRIVPWTSVVVVAVLAAAPAAEREKVPVTGEAVPELAPFDELMTTFVRENEVPGAALAVAKDDKLVYARGFGYADPEQGLPVQPRSRFRIASLSKPITAAAILRLVELGKLKLDDCPFDLLALPTDRKRDPRLKKVTVRQLLQHTGGWDRDVSFDPMFCSVRIARDLGLDPPAGPNDVIRYMLGQKLDFDPGSRYAYSNFGYCVLGRLIEKLSGQPYETYVRQEVLAPLGVHAMQVGRTRQQAKDEVRYFDEKGRTGPSVFGPDFTKQVPTPYGVWSLESLDAVGGWIAPAPDLVRFAAALGRPAGDKLLSADTVRTMFTRPAGPPGLGKDGQPKEAYYGLGWNVRVLGPDRINTWHTGSFAGTASLLVRRHDGLVWAVLFNQRNNAQGRYLATLIDPLVHRAADRVKAWPGRDLFGAGR